MNGAGVTTASWVFVLIQGSYCESDGRAEGGLGRGGDLKMVSGGCGDINGWQGRGDGLAVDSSHDCHRAGSGSV